MLKGTLLAESLRVGHDLQVPGPAVTRLGRQDVSAATTPGSDTAATRTGGATNTQPSIWTFVNFEAPDAGADELANALAAALLTDNGWYADFRVGDDHVVVFAGKVFR